MANAPVLKTGVRKDLGVRIPRPPLPSLAVICAGQLASIAQLLAKRATTASVRSGIRLNSFWFKVAKLMSCEIAVAATSMS